MMLEVKVTFLLESYLYDFAKIKTAGNILPFNNTNYEIVNRKNNYQGIGLCKH